MEMLTFIITIIVMLSIMLGINQVLQVFENKYVANATTIVTKDQKNEQKDLFAEYWLNNTTSVTKVIFTILSYLSIYVFTLMCYIVFYKEPDTKLSINNAFIDDVIENLIKYAPMWFSYCHAKYVGWKISRAKEGQNVDFLIAIPNEDDVTFFTTISGLVMLVFCILNPTISLNSDTVSYIVISMILTNVCKSKTSNTFKRYSGEKEKKPLILRVDRVTSLLSIGYLVLFATTMLNLGFAVLFGVGFGIMLGLLVLTCDTKTLIAKFVFFMRKQVVTYALIVAVYFGQLML